MSRGPGGYFKGMSKNWEPRDKPQTQPVATKTVVIIGPTGKRRVRTEQI